MLFFFSIRNVNIFLKVILVTYLFLFELKFSERVVLLVLINYLRLFCGLWEVGDNSVCDNLLVVIDFVLIL